METKNSEKSITIPSQTQNIDGLVAELVVFVCGSTGIDQHAISLALTEALSNAIIHGNGSNPRKKVFVQVLTGPGRVIFKVADEGKGFDPQNVPDPTKADNLDRLNGRGLFFIRHFMDEVRFNGLGNVITMIKHIN